MGATDSTVNLGGNFTQAALGTFNRTGGTVNLAGTLTGGLTLDVGTGSWTVGGDDQRWDGDGIGWRAVGGKPRKGASPIGRGSAGLHCCQLTIVSGD